MSKFAGLVIVSSAGAFLASGGYTLFTPGPAPGIAGPTASCVIKGNMSINSGERIYHVPGQRDYAATKISPQYGERWFCTEEEARAAGWRKAGR